MTKQPGLVNLSFSKTIELAINTAIHLDEEQGRVFEALDGKVIELWIAPLKTPIFCIINQCKVSTQGFLKGEADATIKTGMRQLIALSLGEPFEHKFIKGDLNTAQTFVNAMQKLEIDWEEHLSHYTGDLVAFKVGHGVRSLLAKKQHAKQYANETIREYLQFEINALPTQNQVSHLIQDIEQTQTEVEQIAERIEKLSKTIN